jgi:hypothetical protein
MEVLYFLTRYTPFWSIPILMISAEFTYLFWIRKKKKIMAFSLIISIVMMLCTAFYFIAGGPEKSVRVMIEIVWFFTR